MSRSLARIPSQGAARLRRVRWKPLHSSLAATPPPARCTVVVARRACCGPRCSMQRAAAPRATSATPRLPQKFRLLSRAAAPPRACVALPRRLPPHGLRGALRSCAPATEPPPARRRALVPSPHSAPRSASSWSVRAVEVRTLLSNPKRFSLTPRRRRRLARRLIRP